MTRLLIASLSLAVLFGLNACAHAPTEPVLPKAVTAPEQPPEDGMKQLSITTTEVDGWIVESQNENGAVVMHFIHPDTLSLVEVILVGTKLIGSAIDGCSAQRLALLIEKPDNFEVGDIEVSADGLTASFGVSFVNEDGFNRKSRMMFHTLTNTPYITLVGMGNWLERYDEQIRADFNLIVEGIGVEEVK